VIKTNIFLCSWSFFLCVVSFLILLSFCVLLCGSAYTDCPLLEECADCPLLEEWMLLLVSSKWNRINIFIVWLRILRILQVWNILKYTFKSVTCIVCWWWRKCSHCFFLPLPCSILSVLQDVTNHSLTVFWFYQSDTAGVKVPELDLELASGTLGGIVTTVEGLVTKISESEYYYYISHLFQSSYHCINALVFVFNFCSNFFSPYILHLTQYLSLLPWNRPSTSPVPSRDMNNDPVVFTSYCNFFVGQTTDHNTSLQLSFQILYYEYHFCSYNICILYYCLASPVN